MGILVAWRSSRKYDLSILGLVLDKIYTQIEVFCKFQVDIPVIARILTVKSLENLHSFILQQPCW